MRQGESDIPPYIVPLSTQAMDIVREMLKLFVPALSAAQPGISRKKYLREHLERSPETHGLSQQDDGAWHSCHLFDGVQ
jgi:hypothetical protein